MKYTSLFFTLVMSLTGCAVATIDEPLDDDGDSNDDLSLDDDGSSPSPSSGGQVLASSGGSFGSSNSTSGGTSGSSAGDGGSFSTPPAGGSSSTGGDSSAGGSDSMDDPPDPSGCTALGHNQDSGEFGTTDAVCFIVDYSDTLYGWRASNAAGRTISVNGEVVGQGDTSSGTVPWPGSAPYLVEFSAGSQANTTWAFW